MSRHGRASPPPLRFGLSAFVDRARDRRGGAARLRAIAGAGGKGCADQGDPEGEHRSESRDDADHAEDRAGRQQWRYGGGAGRQLRRGRGAHRRLPCGGHRTVHAAIPAVRGRDGALRKGGHPPRACLAVGRVRSKGRRRWQRRADGSGGSGGAASCRQSGSADAAGRNGSRSVVPA